MRELRKVRYAPSGGSQLAYRVAGEGPDLVCLFGTIGLVVWDDERTGHFFDRLSSFSRVLFYDARGSGRSDPILPGQPRSVEDRVSDALAVMDHAGMTDGFVVAGHDGGAVGIVLAAAHPDRVRGLFLCNTWARLLVADDYPWGLSQELSDALIAAHRELFGTGFLGDIFFPRLTGDAQAKAWFAEIEQRSASRAQAVLATTQAQQLDVRQVLPAVRVPTVVAHTAANPSIPIEHGRYIAECIPGARLVELPGIDHLVFLDPEPVLEEIEEFVTGTRPGPEPDRVLATVVFTDIVDSTSKAAALGDHRWRQLLDRHDDATRRAANRFGGRVIKTTGDGVLATFDGPTRAVHATATLVHDAWLLGLRLRAGLHTGEIELRGDDIGGIAVHIGARVAALAGPGEVLVSSTVKDLVAGSGISFVDRGIHALKGVPDEWRLFAVEQ